MAHVLVLLHPGPAGDLSKAAREELEEFLAPAPAFGGGFAKMKPKPDAEGNAPAANAPSAAQKTMPKGKMPGGFGRSSIPIIVTGGSNNNYFSMGGMVPSVSVRIDPWR